MHALCARLSSLIILVIVCVATNDAAANQATPELVAAYYDSVTLSGRLQGAVRDDFVISLKCVRYETLANKNVESPPVYIGTDGYDPACAARSLSLALNGKSITFPLNSYTDLADVHVRSTHITTRGQSVVLHIRGGDGVAAYKASFIVEGGNFVAREIEQMNANGELEITRQAF